MYFHYLAIISPWRRAGPFIWTNLNLPHPRMPSTEVSYKCMLYRDNVHIGTEHTDSNWFTSIKANCNSTNMSPYVQCLSMTTSSVESTRHIWIHRNRPEILPAEWSSAKLVVSVHKRKISTQEASFTLLSFTTSRYNIQKLQQNQNKRSNFD